MAQPPGSCQQPLGVGAVSEQRIRSLGYAGAYTILREYVQATRPARKAARAFGAEHIANILRRRKQRASGAVTKARASSRSPAPTPSSSSQRVLFTTAMDMLNHLLAWQVGHSLVRKRKTYTEPALLVCDALGYRQKRSTMITTNTPLSDWGNILFHTTIAMAIADRLVESAG